jgi:outer membrane protein OmpA-like peptidoglycan-associated protein
MKIFCLLLLGLLPLFLSAQEEKQQLIASEAVYYAPNSHIPDAAEKLRLDIFIKKNAASEPSEIIIYSGTDSIGDAEENLLLSQRRSDAIAAYLQLKGFDEKLIKQHNLGESSPSDDNRTESGRRNNRYSRIEFYEAKAILTNVIRISGTLKDDETNKAIADSMVLVFHRDEPDTVYTDKKGNFEIFVPDTVKIVDLFVKDYFFVSLDIDKNNGKEIKVEVPVKKAKIGNKANFDDINFHGGNAVMLTGSYKVCDKIVRFLKYNPNIRVEIAGHVNVPNSFNISTDSWDYTLSVQRAIKVSNYLKEKGINYKRIEPKGYGNWEMLYPKAISEEEQKKNRRVEVRIIK